MSARRPLPVVVVAVGDLLTLFEHVIFGFVVGIPAGAEGCSRSSAAPAATALRRIRLPIAIPTLS